MRKLFIIVAFMLNMLCSEASEINFNNIIAGELQEFQPNVEGDFITFNVGGHTIKFPKDGKQPNVNDAVEWSCAKVGGEHITNWYLKMFGIIDRDCEQSTDEDKYIKAGFSNNSITKLIAVKIKDRVKEVHNKSAAEKSVITHANEKQRIILRGILKNFQGGIHGNIEEYAENAQQRCVNGIKKIAQTTVGRVMLYRLIIEVRRDRCGTDCTDGETDKKERNKLRSLTVLQGDYFAYNRTEGVLYIDSIDTACPLYNENWLTHDICIFVPQNTDLDIAIFHEMLHWYQWLRSYSRASNESYELKHYFYGCTQFNWTPEDDFNCSAFREMRAILGAFSNHYKDFGILDGEIYNEGHPPIFINGDDISENLYRLSCDRSLRFSHINEALYEEKDFCNKYMKLLNENLKKYKN